MPFNLGGSMRFVLVSLLIVVVLSGCGRAATTAGGGSSDQITSELLRAAEPEGLSVFQLIQRHQPRWLRASRGSTTFGNAAGGVAGSVFARVVLDGVPYGELNDLRRLNVTEVEHIEYMGGSDATTRFGTGYAGGAILVRTR